MWDVATKQCLAVLAAGPDGWVMFTADGRYKSAANRASSQRTPLGCAAASWQPPDPMDRSMSRRTDDLIPGIRLPTGQLLADLGPGPRPFDPPIREQSPEIRSCLQVSPHLLPLWSRTPTTSRYPLRQMLRIAFCLPGCTFLICTSATAMQSTAGIKSWCCRHCAQTYRSRFERAGFRPNSILVTRRHRFSGATRRATEYADASEYLLALAADLKAVRPGRVRRAGQPRCAAQRRPGSRPAPLGERAAHRDDSIDEAVKSR